MQLSQPPKNPWLCAARPSIEASERPPPLVLQLELGKLGTWKAWKPAVKAGGDSPIVGWKFWKMGIFIRGRRSLALELEEANLDQRHSSSLCCLGDFWLLPKLQSQLDGSPKIKILMPTNLGLLTSGASARSGHFWHRRCCYGAAVSLGKIFNFPPPT